MSPQTYLFEPVTFFIINRPNHDIDMTSQTTGHMNGATIPVDETDPEDNQPDGRVAEPDDHEEEGFFEDDAGSEESTVSLSPSAYDHEYLHGRTYERSGRYLLPDDEDEQERCDMLYHGIQCAIQDRLHYAPVSALRYVLDVGTGTGLWAVEMADRYPGSVVVRIDISPIQPTIVPPNCKFQIASADDAWEYNYKFDLVHIMAMNDYSVKDWLRCYHEAYNALNPGGWIECKELSYRRVSTDNTIPANSKITAWEDLWAESMRESDLEGHCDPNLIQRQMMAAGFINITRLDFELPIGEWRSEANLKDAGRAGWINAKCGMHSMSVKPFTKNLNWSITRVEDFLLECSEELHKEGVHAHWPVYVIYGQRPEERYREEEGHLPEDAATPT